MRRAELPQEVCLPRQEPANGVVFCLFGSFPAGVAGQDGTSVNMEYQPPTSQIRRTVFEYPHQYRNALLLFLAGHSGLGQRRLYRHTPTGQVHIHLQVARDGGEEVRVFHKLLLQPLVVDGLPLVRVLHLLHVAVYEADVA